MAVIFEVRNGGSDNNGGGFRGGAALATPSAPGVSHSASGGTVAANTYYVVVTESDGNGETSKSGETSTTTTGSTSTITVTSPTNPNSQGATWNVYVGTASGGPYSLQGGGLSFGTNSVITSTPPTTGTQAPGTDFSQQSGAQVVIDGSTINATSSGATATMTLSGYTPTAADVGNCVQVLTGTNATPNVYEIIGWSTTTWVLSNNWCSGVVTSITGNMGGGFATPGKAGGYGGIGIYVKYSATPYNCSSSSNVSGGSVSFLSTQHLIGYDTHRTRWNTDTNRPTLQATSNSMTIITSGGNWSGQMIRNVILDGNSHTSVTGYSGGSTHCRADTCKVTGCTIGYSLAGWSQGVMATNCEASNCDTGFGSFSAGSMCIFCVVDTMPNGSTGFACSGAGACFNCLAIGDGTKIVTGFGGSNCTLLNCVAYKCSNGANDGAGYNLQQDSGGNRSFTMNCIAYGCWVGLAASLTTQDPTQAFLNFAVGGSGSVNFHNGAQIPFAEQLRGVILLTADPFVNGASNNFALNNTAGGGAALRAAGFPSSFAGLSTNNYMDIGAAQHQDLPSSSNTIILC